MIKDIKPGHMAFIEPGAPAVGSVRGVSASTVTIYVENSGDFVLQLAAVTAAHDGKVVLDCAKVGKPFLLAVGHGHDREVPDVAG